MSQIHELPGYEDPGIHTPKSTITETIPDHILEQYSKVNQSLFQRFPHPELMNRPVRNVASSEYPLDEVKITDANYPTELWELIFDPAMTNRFVYGKIGLFDNLCFLPDYNSPHLILLER